MYDRPGLARHSVVVSIIVPDGNSELDGEGKESNLQVVASLI
jgi:hypothetical protein